MYKRTLSILIGFMFSIWGSASAGVIISAESAEGTSVGDLFAIGNTIDQSGLSTGFESGVTDFDTYLASNPTHSTNGADEYWGLGGDTPTLDYDLGAVFTIDALALWNGSIDGISEANIYGSLDGDTYFLLTTILPLENSGGQRYISEIFSFAAAALRYVQIDIVSCHTPPTGYCRVGEVAFRVADVNEVPIPAAFPLLLSGLAGLGFAARRRKMRLD